MGRDRGKGGAKEGYAWTRREMGEIGIKFQEGEQKKRALRERRNEG